MTNTYDGRVKNRAFLDGEKQNLKIHCYYILHSIYCTSVKMKYRTQLFQFCQMVQTFYFLYYQCTHFCYILPM
uniref:Uncharacterized protein n=1 Tax=Arundo donax TaxID=35708 RepID=A0A0A9AQ50_ARUDO